MEAPESEFQKLHFEIGEMWCPSCAEVIRLVLLQERGVRNCVVDYATDLASVEFAPRFISRESIFTIIQSLGYQPLAYDAVRKRGISFDLYLRFIIAAFCSLNVMMFAYPLYATYFEFDDQGVGDLFAWLSFIVSLPVVTYSAWPIWRRFATGIRLGLFGMEALVMIGVSSAFLLSTYELLQGGTRVYFDSMTVVIVFVLLGKIIESRAKFSAKESLFRLNRSLPKRGRKKTEDGSTVYVPAKDLEIGDKIEVRMGETIVLDGIVSCGEGACNESFMTGESLPVVKSCGSKVLGGAILQQGHLTIEVTTKCDESVLHRIIDMVERDLGKKSFYTRAADKVVRWFVPLVLSIAFLTGLVCYALGIADPNKTVNETAVLRAITVLLISCPCAIGIAAPLAESYLINALAGLGAIVRNRGCLQYLGRESVYVFDKTGTITEGVFRVLSGLGSLAEDEKSILKALVERSNHPIACAIDVSVEQSPKAGGIIEEVVGKGIKGIFDGSVYFLGSEKFLRQHGMEVGVVKAQSSEMVTNVYFGKGSGEAIRLELGDQLRPEAEEVIGSLNPKRTVLLSGDGKSCVEWVAKRCGFADFQAEVSPLGKQEYVNGVKSEGEIVCMFGDGINDSPALTAAHVGISVVSATDISIQVSDILLTTDRLTVIPKMQNVARKGRQIIGQNLFWAFSYNVVGICLAIFGMLSPIFAAFAMVASSLFVLFNAQRIR